MDKKGRLRRQTILIFLGLLVVKGIHIHKGNADNALADSDVLDSMAYTENLIEPGQIKTELYKEEPKTHHKKVNLAEMQFNEDQAIAAYGEEVEDKAEQLPAAPKVVQKQFNPKQDKPVLVQKSAPKKEDDDGTSDVDVSAITPDHKNTEPLKIESEKQKSQTLT